MELRAVLNDPQGSCVNLIRIGRQENRTNFLLLRRAATTAGNGAGHMLHSPQGFSCNKDSLPVTN